MSRSIVIALTAVLIASCGGGGGSLPLDDSDEPPGTDAPEGEPNFAVVDFVTSDSFVIGSEEFGFTVTIANIGEVEAEVPPGWLMESASSDFSTGFMRTAYEMVKRGGNGSSTLEPGEEGVFVPRLPQGFNLRTNDIHYVKFWLNPNTGTLFETDEQRVMDSRTIDESSYIDNESETRSVSIAEPNIGWQCEEEALEENDAIDSAPLIALGESYPLVNCLDGIDLLGVEFVAGRSYGIISTGSLGWTNISVLTVVQPDGTYLAQEAGINTVVTATQTGIHHVAAIVYSTLTHEGTVVVSEL